MKKNSYIYLGIIILIGALLRFNGLDKENGLWYDEILAYSFAKEPFPWGIIDSVAKSEFQGVFHYLYLGLWMMLFGDSDLSLRLSSFVFGVSLIPVMFFLGKELHSRGAGFLAALFAALSPVLIYYSQEVRPYALLAFLGAVSFLFLLRLERKPNFLNYLILVVSNVLILYTYTIGFVFVFLQGLFFFLYLKFIEKKPLKDFLIAQIVIIVLYVPYLASVAANFSYYFSSTFIEPFFYSKLSRVSLLITLQDWFTPMLTGIYQHDGVFYSQVFFNGRAGVIFGFILFVCGVFLFGLFRSLACPDRRNYLIFLSCAGFLFFEVLAALNGSFCLVTRHTLLVLPLILLLCASGLSGMKNKKVFIALIAVIISFQLLNLTSAQSVSAWERAGIRPVLKFLSYYNPGKDDLVLVPSHSGFIKKYLPSVKTLDLNYMQAVFLDKSTESLKKFISDPELINKTNKNNSHITLKSFLQNEEPSISLENTLLAAISRLKKGRYFIIVRKTDYAMFEERELMEILQDNKKYQSTAMLRLFSSKVVNDLVKVSSEHLEPVKKEKIEPVWQVYIFQKPAG